MLQNDEKKAGLLVSDDDRDKSLADQLPCQPILQTRPLTPPFGLSESPVLPCLFLSSSLEKDDPASRPALVSPIRGDDSQVPSESFVTEVTSDAPLALNYIS